MALSDSRHSPRSTEGFTVLEVLVAMSILTVTLVAIYQAFATSIFIISSTKNLWNSMVYAQNELLHWERAQNAPLSVVQGKIEEESSPVFGYEWKREISDIDPLPGVTVRKVTYTLKWLEGKNEFTYSADIFIKPK